MWKSILRLLGLESRDGPVPSLPSLPSESKQSYEPELPVEKKKEIPKQKTPKALENLAKIALSQVGVKEVGGNNNGPQVRKYQSSTNLKPASWPWCFDGSVETLTDTGWKKLSEINGSEMVAQVEPKSKTVSFTPPLSWLHIKAPMPISTVKTRSLFFRCDARHKFWGNWNGAKGQNQPSLRSLSEMQSSLSIPSVTTASFGNPNYSNKDLDFIAAFVADGFFSRKLRKNKKLAIQVSKPRKIEVLRTFQMSEYASSKIYGLSKSPLTTFECDVPEYFDEVFSDYKEIRWDWAMSLSAKQAAYFIDRYVFWDGTIKKGTISTSRKQNLDVFSALALMCGRHPNVRHRDYDGKKTCYEMTTKKKKTRTIKKEHVSTEEDDIDLYCIEVPSGIIVCRDSEGTPFVTGNCAAFTSWVVCEWLKDPENVEWLGLKVMTPDKWRPKTAAAFGYISWAKERPATTKVLSKKAKPHVGDFAVFDFSHIGVVTKVLSDGRFQCVEGNTNGKGTRDSKSGDGVWLKTRSPSLVRSFVRINPSTAK
jgi:hypothetical protein